MSFESQKEVLDALRILPRGSARSDILSDKGNRSLVLNTGASLIIYSGNIKDGITIREKLSNINVAVMNRINSKTGNPDGLGTLGGLAERTNPFEFYKMPLADKMRLVGEKDDIVLIDDVPTLTKDIDIIRHNNIIREAKEELSDLGIYDINFKDKDIMQIPFPNLKDDNYIINIWDGKGQSFAVNPYCHTLKTDDEFIDLLHKRSKKAPNKSNAEASSIEKYNLFDMLSCFGKKGGEFQSEDGRNMQKDYRYPHEWFIIWVIAAKTLNDENDMIKLAKEVQTVSSHQIDFESAAGRMGIDISTLARTMGVKDKTIIEMQNIMKEVYNGKKQSINFVYKER